TDERCYSACDYFATLMKESQAALVIGEHFGTGGGGANVWTHSFLSSSFTPLSAYGLTDLPHSQVIRFPIRSFLHLDGINPVEDEGSAPDLILPKTLADVINDSEVQLKRISTLIDGMYNEPYPTAEVEPSNTYLAVDHPQSISWMKSNFHEFGLTGSLHEISDDYVRVGVAEFYDKALDKNFVVALDIPSGSKLQRRVSFEVDTEIQSGSDYIYVYLKTDKGTEQLTKITGTFDDRVTLNLPENKSEVHIWVTSDFDATPGHIVFRDLKIE
ncbi:MAG: hypothetical protein KDD25_07720, partial [Bdellovibrionales bacterium]|nr:hypothetical protein [Bdellovibrionales bacterium]